MVYEVSCGFVLINSNSGKILLLKNENEFEWGVPKGHQENESELEAALREVCEETQIDVSKINIIKTLEGNPIKTYFDYKSPVSGNIRRIILFLGSTEENPIISQEHCGFAWCNLNEALIYLRFKDIQNSLKQLYSDYLSLQ